MNLNAKGVVPSSSERGSIRGTPEATLLAHTSWHLTHAQLYTMKATSDFHYQFYEETKHEMDRMGDIVKRKRQQVTKKELEVEFKQWFHDSDFSRTWDTEIFWLIELYWMNKAFIAQVVEEKANQQESVLHKLNIMDHKFDALCRDIFNIEITINI